MLNCQVGARSQRSGWGLYSKVKVWLVDTAMSSYQIKLANSWFHNRTEIFNVHFGRMTFINSTTRYLGWRVVRSKTKMHPRITTKLDDRGNGVLNCYKRLCRQIVIQFIWLEVSNDNISKLKFSEFFQNSDTNDNILKWEFLIIFQNSLHVNILSLPLKLEG